MSGKFRQQLATLLIKVLPTVVLTNLFPFKFINNGSQAEKPASIGNANHLDYSRVSSPEVDEYLSDAHLHSILSNGSREERPARNALRMLTLTLQNIAKYFVSYIEYFILCGWHLVVLAFSSLSSLSSLFDLIHCSIFVVCANLCYVILPFRSHRRRTAYEIMALQGQQGTELAAKGIRWSWPADASFDQFDDCCGHERRQLVFLQYEFERDSPDDEKSSLKLRFWVPGMSKFRMYCEPQRILLHFQSHDLVFCRRNDGLPDRTVFEFTLALCRPYMLDTFVADGSKNVIELTTHDEALSSSVGSNSPLELKTPSTPRTLRKQRLANGTDENNPFIGPLLSKDKFMLIDAGSNGLHSYELLLTLPRGVLMEPRHAFQVKDENLLSQRGELCVAHAGGGDDNSRRNMLNSQLLLPAGGDSTNKFMRVMESIKREKEALVWAKSELPYRFIGLDRHSLADIRSFYQKKLQLSKFSPCSFDDCFQKFVQCFRKCCGYRTGNINHGYTGIDNVGNSCFMSCVLQALCNTREFRDYFLSNVYEIEKNPSNPLASEGCRLLQRFAEFMNELWLSNYSSIKPTGLRKYIADKNEIFGGYGQQDAQEFLQFLLDGLHEDLNRVKKKVPTGDIDSKDKTDEQLFHETHRQMLKWQDSVVMDLFYGFFKNTMQCLSCDEVSTKFDPFLFLPLPLPEPQQYVSVVYMPYDMSTPVTPNSKPDSVVKFDLSFGRQDKLSAIFDIITLHCDVPASYLRAVVVRGPTIQLLLEPNEFLSKIDLRHDLNDTICVFQSRCPRDFEGLRSGDVREFYVVQKLATQRPSLPPRFLMRARQNNLKAACKACGCNVSATRRCTVCRSVSYCSSDCQRADWQQHKQQCLPYKKLLTSVPLFVCIHISEIRQLWNMIVRKVAQFNSVVIKNLAEPPMPIRVVAGAERQKPAQNAVENGEDAGQGSSSDDTEISREDKQSRKLKRSLLDESNNAIVAPPVLSPSPPSSTNGRSGGSGQADSGIASETQSECDSVSGIGSSVTPPQPQSTNAEPSDSDATPPVAAVNDAVNELGKKSAQRSPPADGTKSRAVSAKNPTSPTVTSGDENEDSLSFWPQPAQYLYLAEDQRPFCLFGLHPDYFVKIVRGEEQFVCEFQPQLSDDGVVDGIWHGEAIVNAGDVFVGENVFLLEWKTNEAFQHVSPAGNGLLPAKVVWVETRVDMPVVEDASCRLRKEQLAGAADRRKAATETADEEQAQGDSFENSKPYGRRSSYGGSSSSSSSTYKLIDLFDHFTRPEILRRHDEAWKCPKCNTRGESIKRLQLWSLPTILVIQLKRFSDQQQGSMMNPLMANFYSSQWQTQRVKKNDMVEYPHVLDLSDCIENTHITDSSGNASSASHNEEGENNGKNKYLYDLYAIVFHHGQAHYGHYTAACRLYSFPDTSCDIIPWRNCDDNVVTTVNTNNRFSNELISRNAYLLFYRRRQHRATIHLGGYKMTLPAEMRDADALDDDDELPPPATPLPDLSLADAVDMPAAGNSDEHWQGPLLPPPTGDSSLRLDLKSVPKAEHYTGTSEEYAERGYGRRISNFDIKQNINGDLPNLITNTPKHSPVDDEILDRVFVNNNHQPNARGALSAEGEWPTNDGSLFARNTRRRGIDYSSQQEQFNRLYGEEEGNWPKSSGDFRKDHDQHSDYDSDDPNGRVNNMIDPSLQVHNISPECKAQFLYNSGATDDLERQRNLSGGLFNDSDVAAICAHALNATDEDEEDGGTGSDVVKPTPLFISPELMSEAMARQISDDSDDEQLDDGKTVTAHRYGQAATLLEYSPRKRAEVDAARAHAPQPNLPSMSRQDLLFSSSRSPQMDKFMESLPSSSSAGEFLPTATAQPPSPVKAHVQQSTVCPSMSLASADVCPSTPPVECNSSKPAVETSGVDFAQPSDGGSYSVQNSVSAVQSNQSGDAGVNSPAKRNSHSKRLNKKQREKAKKYAAVAEEKVKSISKQPVRMGEDADSTGGSVVNGHHVELTENGASLSAVHDDPDKQQLVAEIAKPSEPVIDGRHDALKNNTQRPLVDDENIECMD